MRHLGLILLLLLLHLQWQQTAAASAPQAVYTVDRSDDIGGLACTTGDSNDCTLRSAIEKSNASVASDTINFDAAYKIDLTSSLPAISDNVLITALVPAHDVEINANGQSVIFTISTDDVTVEGLDLDDRTQSGTTTLFSIQPSADRVIIRHNLLGDYFDGTTNCGGFQGGSSAVKIFGAGSAGVTRATIYGNTIRCLQSIALNVGGEVVIGANTSGTAGAAERNVISQNGGDAIYSTGNDGIIRNNEIAGSNTGVVLTGDDNLVYDNDIHGNSNGVTVFGDRNEVYGNLIYANSFDGIQLFTNASSNVVGCPTLALSLDPARRNQIYSNGSDGIRISGSGANLNVINCNQIGFSTLRGGSGNGGDGISVENNASNTIIGVLDVTGNEIGGNGGHGIKLENSSATAIKGNFIGVKRGGTVTGNSLSGIAVWSGAAGTTIGTDVNSNRNVIGANVEFGIHIDGAAAGIVIGRNTIGAYRFGSLWWARGNGFAGVGVYNVSDADIGLSSGCASAPDCLYIAHNLNEGIFVEDASGVTIGEDSIIAANGTAGLHINNGDSNLVRAAEIVSNGGPGIVVSGSALFNNVAANYGASNGGLPIDLGYDGFDGYDSGDPDSGPNSRLNYPTVNSQIGTTVNGSACPNCSVLVYEALSPTHLPGSGVDYKGFTTANGSGSWSIDLAPLGLTPADAAYQAIAADGNASEISPQAGVPLSITLAGAAASSESALPLLLVMLLLTIAVIAQRRTQLHSTMLTVVDDTL